MSKIKEVLEAIQEKLTDDWVWDTDPTAEWFPNLEQTKLRTNGLSAIVLPVNSPIDPAARSIQQQQPNIHIAIVAPIEAGGLDEGDAVVELAEEIGRALVHTTLALAGGGSVAIVEAGLEPVIVADMARQFNLWVSYLKLEVSVND